MQENCRNRSKSVKNKSGFIGVYFDKDRNKWVAFITIDYKQIKLGRFVEKEDAIKARLEAEFKYFGSEFAPQRHLFSKYDISPSKSMNELRVIFQTDPNKRKDLPIVIKTISSPLALLEEEEGNKPEATFHQLQHKNMGIEELVIVKNIFFREFVF